MQEEGINIEQKNSHKRVNIMLFLFHVVKEQTKLIYDYLWRWMTEGGSWPEW